MSAAITLERVWASRGDVAVLRDVSLSIAPAEVVALVGPSGAGKSTLLRVILGLCTPARGRVRLGGAIASDDRRIVLPPEERRLGMVFQDLALWPHLTVQGNLAFVLESQRVDRAEREARIDTWLRRVGLLDKRHRRPDALSGGERQRVALARALVAEPAAILMDEPLTNLDVLLRRQLLDLFREILAERRTTALYVTHDPREAAALADHLAVIAEGRIVQAGTLAELRRQPGSDFVRALVADVA